MSDDDDEDDINTTTTPETEEDKKSKLKWIELSNVIKFLEKKGMELKECAYIQSRTEFIKGKILKHKRSL